MQQTLHYQVVRIYKLVIMKFMNCSNLHWSRRPDTDIEGDELEVEDKTIYMINDYGQLQAINEDLSGLEDEETKENQTELEAVIDHIESITTRLEIEEVKRPSFPPLPENVYQED